LLNVKKQLIQKFTSESQEVMDAIAINLSKLIKAYIHAAVTGLASAGGSKTKAKPVGTVYYSFLFRGKLFKTKKRFYGSPLEIKDKACEFYFKFITRKAQNCL